MGFLNWLGLGTEKGSSPDTRTLQERIDDRNLKLIDTATEVCSGMGPSLCLFEDLTEDRLNVLPARKVEALIDFATLILTSNAYNGRTGSIAMFSVSEFGQKFMKQDKLAEAMIEAFKKSDRGSPDDSLAIAYIRRNRGNASTIIATVLDGIIEEYLREPANAENFLFHLKSFDAEFNRQYGLYPPFNFDYANLPQNIKATLKAAAEKSTRDLPASILTGLGILPTGSFNGPAPVPKPPGKLKQ